MGTSRVFVSYHTLDSASHAHLVAMRLVEALRAAQVEVVLDNAAVADADYVQYLNGVLPACQWFIVVQTQETLHAPRVSLAVNTALSLVFHRRMEGILQLTAAPYAVNELPATWSTIRAFDATRDYERAVTRALIELGLDGSPRGARPSSAPLPSISLSSPASAAPAEDGHPTPLSPAPTNRPSRAAQWLATNAAPPAPNDGEPIPFQVQSSTTSHSVDSRFDRPDYLPVQPHFANPLSKGKGPVHQRPLFVMSLIIILAILAGSLTFALHLPQSSGQEKGVSTQVSTPTEAPSNAPTKGGVTKKIPSTASPARTPNAAMTTTPVPASSPSPIRIMPSPSPTPVAPTLTASPTSIEVYNASPNCSIDTHGGTAGLTMCSIVLSNTSRTAKDLNWSASMNPPDYTLSPSSGTLAPSQSATLSFSSSSPTCPGHETLILKGSANTVQVPVTCTQILIQPYNSIFSNADCTHNNDWTCIITVTASQGNPVNTPWQVSAATPAGVTFSQTSGTLAPGTSVQVTITIASTDCPGSNSFTFTGGLFNPENGLDWSC
jgi:hypothetical protein